MLSSPLSLLPFPFPNTDFTFEVPTPLVVGQPVTAYHEKAKLLARGHILTCEYERGRYRVQFERPELSSLICQDSDIAVHGAPSLLLVGKPSRRQRLQDTDTSIYGGVSVLHHPPSRMRSSSLLPHHCYSAALKTMEVEEQEEGGEEGIENSEKDKPQHVSKQQQEAQLMIFTLKMLDWKNVLIATLRELNQQGEAEVAAASTAAAASSRSSSNDNNISNNNSCRGSSGSNNGGLLLFKSGGQSKIDLSGFEFSSIFKQEYAWVVCALQHTNVLLASALEGLQKLTQHQRQGVADKQSTEGGMYCLQLYNGMLVSRVVRETVESARAEGKEACKRHIAAKYEDMLSLSLDKYADNDAAAGAAVSGEKNVALEEGGAVQGVIEAGATLLMMIRRCAEERHKCLSGCNDDEDKKERKEEEEKEEEEEEEEEERGEEEEEEEEEEEDEEEEEEEEEEGGASTASAAVHRMSAMEVEQCMGVAVLELKRQLVLLDGAGGDAMEEEEEEEGKEEEEEEDLLQEKRCLLDDIECVVGMFKDELLTCREG